MPPDSFPSGLSEKLPLDTPTLWDVDEFKRHERMAVSRGNTALEGTFAKTKTDLPRLIACVRWSILRMPPRKFSTAVGISLNGYIPMEHDWEADGKTGVHTSKYTKLLQYWKRKGISSGIREQLLDLLTNPELLAIHPSCTDLLSSIDFIRRKSLDLLDHRSVSAFYHRISYDVGRAQIDEKFPSFFNRLWQREKAGVVPCFLEMKQFINTIYAGTSKEMSYRRALRMAQAEAIWTDVRRKQYTDRTVEPPMAEYLTEAEKHLAVAHERSLTAMSLIEVFGQTPLHAEKLIQTEFISSENIEKDVHMFMDEERSKRFLRAWSREGGKEERRMTFGKCYSAAMKERGFTTADVAKLIGVTPPEERGQRTNRKSRFRPESEVRGVLFQNHVSSQIAVEALIQVIARDPDHADTLRSLYCTYRERHYRRTGHALRGDGLRMRLWRELANVNMDDLARQFLPRTRQTDSTAIHRKNQELQKLERQEGKEHTISFEEVFSFLEHVASERAQEAPVRLGEFHEVDEALKEFRTIQEMAQHLIAGFKGARAVSEAMRDSARNDSQWLRADLITKMSEGSFVSALPPLRLMAMCTIDRVLPESVVRDWHERFPEQLEKGVMDFGKVSTPLARMLCTLIAMREENPIRFFRDRVPGIVPTIGTKHLRELSAGEDVDWEYIHKYLLAVSVKPGEAVYQLAKMLHANGGNVGAAMAEIAPLLQRSSKEIHPSNLPGLHLEELRPFTQQTIK